MPESRGARSSYAQFLARAGDWAAAEQQLREVLRIVPDDESALDPLVKHLEQSSKAEEARKFALAAYAYNPRSFDNNLRLVRMAEIQGDSEKIAQYLSALAASGPVNGRLYFDLAVHLAKLGHLDEMKTALAKARRISNAQHDTATAQEVDEMIRQYGN